MRLCLALSIALSLTACKEDQNKPADPAPAPVAPSPAPAPAAAPAPTPAPAPAPAPPAAEFTGDVKAFIAGRVAGYDAATQELAVYAQIVGDEEFVAIRRYQVGGTGPSTAGGEVRLAKTDEAVVKSALAGLAAVTGTPLTAKPARLHVGAIVAFDSRTKQLTVRIDGKADTRKLDGGGVTTPTPRTAFAVPGTKRVAVTVEYVGDVVRTQDLEVFGGAAPAAATP